MPGVVVHREVEEDLRPLELVDEFRRRVEVHDHVGVDPAASVHRPAPVGVADLLGRLDQVLLLLVVGQVVLQRIVVALNQAAAGSVVTGRRQGERRVVAEGIDGLDQPLAPRGVAHDETTVMVLHGPRDDLGGAGAELVHQNHERQVRAVARPGGAVLLVAAVDPPLRVDDHLVLPQESVCDPHRLLQEAAGVAAQV